MIIKQAIAINSEGLVINSFSEGNQTSLLQVRGSSEIQELDSSNFLSSKIIEDGKTVYVLTCPNFDALKRIEELLRSNEIVESIQLNK